MTLLVAGGRQSREAGVVDRTHGPLYDRAILARLDVDRGLVEPVLEREDRRFGALSLDGDTVVACTDRDVLRIATDGRVLDVQSHPWLADVHHALVIDDVAHAASTGIDGVIALGPQPTFLPTIRGACPPANEGAPGPSRTHANFVFQVDGVVHVTRGTRGDAVALRDLDRPWAIAPVVVHDGIVTGEGVWFTRVDGRLVLVDPGTGRIAHTVELHQAGDGTEPLGWCRGLAICDGIAWVGFSRLRATRLRRHLAWARGRLRGRPVATRRPTRIEGFELATGRRVRSIPLLDVGIDALFGVVEEPGR